MADSADSRPRGTTRSIGQVLALLRDDFPDVSISKIRFLESEGLIAPQRAASGYRRYAETDVDRLRYVLAVQREHYVPLKVIREHLEQIDILDRKTQATSRHDCGGLFVFIGADAETEWLPQEVARDARGYVLTGDDVIEAGRWSESRDPYLLESSVPGVFACGDVRLSPIKRVASAVGEGSMAIAFVHQYLKEAETPVAG